MWNSNSLIAWLIAPQRSRRRRDRSSPAADARQAGTPASWWPRAAAQPSCARRGTTCSHTWVTSPAGRDPGRELDQVDAELGVPLHLRDEPVGVADRVAAAVDRPLDRAGSRPTSSQCRPSTSSLCADLVDVASRRGCRRRRTGRPAAASSLAAAADQDRRVRLLDRRAASRSSRPAGSACPRTARRRRSTSGGRSAASPRAARTARPAAGTARRGRGARARTTRRRCRASPGRPRARRASSTILASSPGWR